MRYIAYAIVLCLLPGEVFAESFEAPFFAQYCVACHGVDQPEGEVRLDPLSESRLANREFLETLIGVLDEREMPPAKEPQPADDLRRTMVQGLKRRLREVAPPSLLKRLTREEYTNTINDLLDTNFELTEFLPDDPSGERFNKAGESLLMSPYQVQAYLKTARFVANQLILDEKPLVRGWDFEIENFRGSSRGDYQTKDSHVLTTNYPWRSNLHFSTSGDSEELFEIPEFGRYRFEADVTIVNSELDQTIGVNSGDPRYPTNLKKIQRFVLPNQASSLSLDLTLLPGTEISFTFDSAATWNIGEGAEKHRKYAGPKLIFNRVKITGPIYDEWPTVAERRILLSESEDPAELAQHLATLFIHRPLPQKDLDAITDLGQRTLDAGGTYRMAARRMVTAILSSPYFLYKHEPSTLDDRAFAARLAYFLWNSGPDEELLRAADSGELQSKELLQAQLVRMLASPKVFRFCEDFTRQWLQTDRIDDVAPDHRLFTNVTTLHIDALSGEANALFREILLKKLSMVNFIDSDFAMVNDLTAEFYDYPPVSGREFRPQNFASDSQRGGLIGQAGILKLTSGSFSTSPILRGVWILKNLYGEKLEPPADLKIEEPDIRGAKTMKEIMAQHQNVETCNRCHRKIDPLGLALEHYDSLGRWRDEYTHVEVLANSDNGETLKTSRMPIDTTASLWDGRPVNSLPAVKSILLADKELVLKNIVSKLISYSTGRDAGLQEEVFINDVYRQIEESDFSLHEAIVAICTHPAFLRK
ncbi:DUF1592 domain-containing protein [Aureliella helgolandensis]|nr:DUF1592 domain-containing protein [Aureliella helgolandensis]